MMDECCLIVITILFPPAGVLLASGCGADFVINLCLTFLGFLPGLIHGIYVVMKQSARKSQYVLVNSVHGNEECLPPPQNIYNQTPPPPPLQHQQYQSKSYPPPPPYS